MPTYTINLPREIKPESLLESCTRAARSLGFKAAVKDQFSDEIIMGNNYPQRAYKGTDIEVTKQGVILNTLLFTVTGIKKGEDRKYFFVQTSLASGCASSREIQNYVNQVQEFLPK